MNRMRFTAQELYIIAAAAGKDRMFGIPDGFEWLSDEEAPAIQQSIKDALLDEGVLVMNFDGAISLSSYYKDFAGIYCDCQKCLTVNRQSINGQSEDVIIWMNEDTLSRADVEDEWYIFCRESRETALNFLQSFRWHGAPVPVLPEITIPQIALKKAKRFATNGNAEEALRILLQNGAERRAATVILDGLQEKAQYFGMLVMDRYGRKTELSFLSSRGVIFSMNTVVVNFRTCTSFKECEESFAEDEIINLSYRFFAMNEVR